MIILQCRVQSLSIVLSCFLVGYLVDDSKHSSELIDSDFFFPLIPLSKCQHSSRSIMAIVDFLCVLPVYIRQETMKRVVRIPFVLLSDPKRLTLTTLNMMIRSLWVWSLFEFVHHYRIERTENDPLPSWLLHALHSHRCVLRWYLLDCTQVSFNRLLQLASSRGFYLRWLFLLNHVWLGRDQEFRATHRPTLKQLLVERAATGVSLRWS